MLALPRQLSESLRFTPSQFAALCAANPEAMLELTAEGHLVTRPPTGGETGRRNTRLLTRLQLWADRRGDWLIFDSSTGFLLPDGSVLSPDASAVSLERWQALSPAERQGFPPLCPDLVIELASPSDRLAALQRKMATYQANGARLGWLLQPVSQEVEVWPQQGPPQRLSGASHLSAEPLLPGLHLALDEIWRV